MLKVESGAAHHYITAVSAPPLQRASTGVSVRSEPTPRPLKISCAPDARQPPTSASFILSYQHA